MLVAITTGSQKSVRYQLVPVSQKWISLSEQLRIIEASNYVSLHLPLIDIDTSAVRDMVGVVRYR